MERAGARAGEGLRLLIAAFGDPGHAFPAIALGRALAARGHEVSLQTWSRWREHVEAEGMRFRPAPEYRVWPGGRADALPPYVAAVRAAAETRPLIRELDPHAVVVDILTTAASLAAEAEDRPWASLVPHVLPTHEPGFPPYSIGARLPRTRAGAALWRALDPLTLKAVRQGREELNGARARAGLGPVEHLHGGISRRLALVATFPALEYPRRRWEPGVRITGPMLWEPPAGEPRAEVEEALAASEADGRPLVVVAPSTSQDPEGRLLAAALEGLRREPVRVLAATAHRAGPAGVTLPPNAVLAPWLPYRRVMPRAAAVVCHGGHGTVAHALSAGAPVLVSPGGGDMAETGARLSFVGAGLSLPRRLTTPRGLRLALRRLLGDSRHAEGAARFARWARENDGAVAGAEAVEGLARPATASGG